MISGDEGRPNSRTLQRKDIDDMVTRDHAPAGAPCWADLWTSDIDGARRFYGELFGWEAEDPNPEFGGYFQFFLNGTGVAGCMGDMGDMKASNAWRPYISSDDIAKTLEVAGANGAQIVVPAMPVADLGIQGVLIDPGGASIGVWQPGTFPGFTVLGEHGAPSWFELHTRGHGRSVEFYRAVFGIDTTAVSDSDDFRYFTFRPAAGGDDVGGIMDGTRFRPEGTPDGWDVYWEVDDCAASVERAKALGASLIQGPDPTPYGVLAHLADPAGAQFKLRTSPRD
jgi:predicted enzyme related to lactoylglutathione lyase